MKRRTYLALFLLTTVITTGAICINCGTCGFFGGEMASALSYQSTEDLTFKLNSSFSIDVSGDLSINSLTPSNYSDSNIITITVGSNSLHGYSLYSTVGSSTYNSTELRLNGTSTTNKFTSLSSNVASLANFSDSNWGYSYCNSTSSASACDSTTNWVSGNTGSTNTGYNGLPLYDNSNSAAGIKLIDTNTPTTNTIKFKIGAKASSSQIAGAYTNIVNFTGVAKTVVTSYTINYTDSSGEGTNLPSQQTGTTTDGAITLSSTIPVRTNYTFKGWCDTSTSDDTCSGTLIKPGGIYALGASPSSITKTMYAVWESGGGGNQMQNWDGCSSLAIGDTVTLTDERDGKEYLVGKLADNNCWMLDNLALDPTTLTQAQLYGTGSDAGKMTNASNTTLGYLKGATTGTTSDKYATAAVSYWTSSYSYSAPLIAIKNASNTDWNPDTVPSNSDLGAGSRKIGVYYNYCAASAGSYCYGSGTSAGTSSGDATESLCPYGWRMPTGGDSGEFNTLYTNSNYNTYTKYKTALSLPLSGYFYSGSADRQGSGGFWWSSTRNYNYSMYRLVLNTSLVYPTTNDYRSYGISLRCVLGS